MTRFRAATMASLSVVWLAGLMMLTHAKTASATLDCDENPEYCQITWCPDTDCEGVRDCTFRTNGHCSVNTSGTTCTNTLC